MIHFQVSINSKWWYKDAGDGLNASIWLLGNTCRPTAVGPTPSLGFKNISFPLDKCCWLRLHKNQKKGEIEFRRIFHWLFSHLSTVLSAYNSKVGISRNLTHKLLLKRPCHCNNTYSSCLTKCGIARADNNREFSQFTAYFCLVVADKEANIFDLYGSTIQPWNIYWRNIPLGER